MKIISHGKPISITRRFVCNKCGCIFEANENEYTYIMCMNQDNYYCKCPDCGTVVYTGDE